MLEIKKSRDDAGTDELVVMGSIGEPAGHTDKLRMLIAEYLSDHHDGPAHQEIVDLYFKIRDFLNIYDLLGEDYCIYNAFTADRDFYVKFMCIDPARNLRRCMGHARSTILFSATLLPIQYYKSLLGGKAEDYEVYAESVFDRSNRLLIQADDVTTRYTERSELSYHKMAEYIHRIYSFCPVILLHEPCCGHIYG